MTLRKSLAITTLLLSAACASTGGRPHDSANRSSSAIRAAEEVGATNHPDSALYLQLAKEQFEHAQSLNGREQEVTDRLLRRAQVDAELSLALARSETEKAEALAAIDKLKKVKQSAPQ